MTWFYIALGFIGIVAIITIEEKAKEYIIEKGYKLSKPIQLLLAVVGAGLISLVIFYIRH
ncbi:hypothetical protein [Neobacillus bataviensis]|uniref:hypothetical protein n=1 Tax=Neobacillus bataviensis TaxID=220685 RepID=UPI001CBB7977|nr:hypothetical protein [Neobacillus bataviensis]